MRVANEIWYSLLTSLLIWIFRENLFLFYSCVISGASSCCLIVFILHRSCIHDRDAFPSLFVILVSRVSLHILSTDLYQYLSPIHLWFLTFANSQLFLSLSIGWVSTLSDFQTLLTFNFCWFSTLGVCQLLLTFNFSSLLDFSEFKIWFEIEHKRKSSLVKILNGLKRIIS